MEYEIKGGSFPVVICRLRDGERMITEKGSMVWMSPNMEMETRGGGLGKMFSKAFSGESMFQNIYTARGDGMIAFGSSFPGKILPLEVSGGRELIMQKSSFLASEETVDLSIAFNKKMGAGFFGGEGFIMQKLSGRGMAFVEIDGDLVEYDLAPGQQIVVDTGNVAGYESTVTMDVRQVPGLKNKLMGGEGLFNTYLTGPGKVMLQTMPISSSVVCINAEEAGITPARISRKIQSFPYPSNISADNITRGKEKVLKRWGQAVPEVLPGSHKARTMTMEGG